MDQPRFQKTRRVSRFYLLLVQVIAACFTITAACLPTNAQEQTRPNFLFIMVDDLGPEWIGCYGADNIETPRIDELAKTGMLFKNAYSMPKCTPTRATLLTGQYPFRHGWVNHWDVPRWGAGCHFDPAEYTTFAELLQQNGYKTAIAGKWQINDFRVQPDVLAEHGFDQWCMWTGFESQNPPSAERYWDAYVHTREGSKTYKGEFGPDVYTNFLCEFMKQHRDEPMLLYFPMALTHTPLVATPADPDAQTPLDKHRAMVRYTDKLVGRLIDQLEELEIRDQTYIFFTTDNGTARGITGSINGTEIKGGKGLLTESGCREPFIVSRPGVVAANESTECLTDFTDILPTLCELAKVDLPRVDQDSTIQLDGFSLASVLHGEADSSKRQWVLSMGGGTARRDESGRVVPALPFAARMIRDERFKLVVDSNREPKSLYDLQNDRFEQHDLLANGVDSLDQDAANAMAKLMKVIDQMPDQDAAPKYTPTAEQPWDRKR